MYEKSRRDTGKWGWKQCEVTTSIVSKFVMQKIDLSLEKLPSLDLFFISVWLIFQFRNPAEVFEVKYHQCKDQSCFFFFDRLYLEEENID